MSITDPDFMQSVGLVLQSDVHGFRRRPNG